MAVSVETFARAEEAARAIGSGDDARVFGGGTLLMPAVNAGATSFRRIVRVTDPAMRQILAEGASVRIGASVTMAQIMASGDTAFLAGVARTVGGPAIRNMATVGGNLFAHPPYGDFTTALLALDATVEFAGQASSAVKIDDFLRDRDRQGGRIIASISVPKPQEQGAFRWLKVSRVKPKGVAVISIAAHVPQSGRGVRIAFGNMAPAPVRALGAERALEGKTRNPASIDQAVAAVLEGLSPATDALASEWYRREIAPVHLRRLLSGDAIQERK